MYDPDNSSEVAVVSCFDPNNNISDSIDHNSFLHETNPNNSSPFTQIYPTNSHEMMGYPNFDENSNNNTSDLLTLLHLPRCSLFPPSSSISFAPKSPSSSSSPPAFLGEINNMNIDMIHENVSGGSGGLSYDPASAATLPYDPHFHLNLPPQPSPLWRDLMLQSLQHGYTSNGAGPTRGNCSMFSRMEDGEGSNNMSMNGIGGLYPENGGHMINHGSSSNNNNGIFEFTRGGSVDIDVKMGNKGPKNFVTEKQRRLNFNDKYDALKKLIPTPTKPDRASIVFDAISYINELKRTVGELKLLVEKNRISKERTKRLKTEYNNPSDQNGGENGNGHGMEGTGFVKPDPEEAFAGSAATQLRSSWLKRKFKDTEVDVRIVDDEVTIKLVQRKKMNYLLIVSRTLDDLQLDLRHVAGGHVGDYYSYLFNSKICEGSTVYASAIANKLIDVVERQYAAASVAVAVAVAPTTSY